MKDTKKQVVILDRFSSPYIRQAILILKEPVAAPEEAILAEAERIVETYLSEKKKKGIKAFFPWILTALSCVLCLSFFLLNN